MAFDFRDLAVPIIVAPMAGGPSTPELAAAGTNAGGLGFVPAGYLTADAFAERLAAARRLTSGPIGANLFAPQPSAGTPEGIERYSKALEPEAERYGVQLGDPRFDDDHWAAKIDVLLDVRPDVASFTFGAPSAAFVITAPPYEWPTKTMSPLCASITRRVVATSSAYEVSGF